MVSISVLMPCYNAENTLPEALESLRSQTLTDFEIVAVDDGSTDRTPQLLRDFALNDERLRVQFRDHVGIVGTLNFGLSVCQAPYIARMDADDYAYPERLENQLKYMLANPDVDVLSCVVEGFPPDDVRQGFQVYLDWLNGLQSNSDIRREIFVESPLPHPSVIFRRERILKVGGYQDRGWAEDYDLWLRLYLDGARFAKLPRTLLAWREHPERLTRTDGRYSLENFLRAKAYYLRHGPLYNRDAVIIWGAGMIGRRLSKHLIRQAIPLVAFIDIDPKKIDRTLRRKPIIPPESLAEWWSRYQDPVLLAAVGARGAREAIRAYLDDFGLIEAENWWSVA